eukprot:TRINITY_DN13038_c0_g1_i2.p1 TRINITY_DN13038_c0_g1~~TRINITY_DN13038_c0_g1_i2.p1  ORF type:complete len:1235 (+),score=315.44 TRINITY_DN13038_c0_g1_i2:38-3706(+)
MAPGRFGLFRKFRPLAPEDEKTLNRIWDMCKIGDSGAIQIRDLRRVVLDNPEIADFFGLKDACPQEVNAFLNDIDKDGNKSVEKDELRQWYSGVVKEIAGKKLEAEAPPQPVWRSTGGHLLPHKAPKRLSNDDLMEATLRGDVVLVRRLVDAGVSVNAPLRPLRDSEYMTILHILASMPVMPNGARIMAEVLHRKADVDVRSSFGSSPLIFACLHKHSGAAELLLRGGADPSCADDHSRTPARCAVINAEGMPQERHENEAVDLLTLLANWGADLDFGGTHSPQPIVEAVLQDSEVLVNSLLNLGAKPLGFHEAVEVGNCNIIRSLVEADANPFIQNKDGNTVMDVALASGGEEVKEILRDFIGRLEREQHSHLKTLEENMRRMKALEKKSLEDSSDLAEPEVAVKQRHWLVRKTASICRKIAKNNIYTGFMLFILALALFLPDCFSLTESTEYQILDGFVVVIFFLFFIEFSVQVVGFWDTYVGKFFFWMDLLGMFSVPLDHSLVNETVMDTLKGMDNSVVVRATRLAKLGARAGRFTKLVKLMRFLPGMGNSEKKDESMAKNVSAKINMTLSTQVSCLIIVMFIVLPIFEFFRYPADDHSQLAWTKTVEDTSLTFPEGLYEVLEDMLSFYEGFNYFPFEVRTVFANGTNATIRLDADSPIREADIKTLSSGSTEVLFNFSAPAQIDALMNVLLIITISVIMTAAAILVSGSVQKIVLSPLDDLMKCIQKIAGNLFNTVMSMSKKMHKGDKEEAAAKGGGDEDEDEFGNELKLLDKVLGKIGALAKIAASKKGADVTQDFGKIAENERALLQGWTCTNLGDKSEDKEEDPEHMYGQGGEQYKEVIDSILSEAEVTWEQMEDWNFNIAGLSEKQCAAVCMGSILHQGALKVEAVPTYTAFIREVAAGYYNWQQVPYHNWLHAVDVTHTLARIIATCSAETYLSANERLALLVSAMAHDIGHIGRNNHFITETAHELAMRYNDSSPLENMHASRLFEITRYENCAIFAHLERKQYQEVRYYCVDAILHTDNSKHFTMVKEVQLLYDTHPSLFDEALEDCLDKSADFPPTEAMEALRMPDSKKVIRNLLLHLSDMSNPLKEWSLCRDWTMSIVEEFFAQGAELQAAGLPVQQLYDRAAVSIPQSQMGYIEYFVIPMVSDTVLILPPLFFLEDAMLETLCHWRQEWFDSATAPSDEDQKKIMEKHQRFWDTTKMALWQQGKHHYG